MYTCTGKLRTCVHLVLCVARLQYLRIDIDLNLLHQYPQTQPVASKDKAKNLIRKPDTQKKPNLTPRETESPNWCNKVTQLKPKLVPQGSKRPPKTPKKRQSDPTEARMGPTWLQEGLPRDPKRPQKRAQTMHGRPLGKNYCRQLPLEGHLARKCNPSRTKTYARKKIHGKTICAIPYARRPNFKPRGAKMQYCRKNASKWIKKYWFYIGLSSIFLNTISEFIENRWRDDTFWIQT